MKVIGSNVRVNLRNINKMEVTQSDETFYLKIYFSSGDPLEVVYGNKNERDLAVEVLDAHVDALK